MDTTNIRNKRIILSIFLFLIFITIFLWSYSTPYMLDDFVYSNNIYNNVLKIH